MLLSESPIHARQIFPTQLTMPVILLATISAFPFSIRSIRPSRMLLD